MSPRSGQCLVRSAGRAAQTRAGWCGIWSRSPSSTRWQIHATETPMVAEIRPVLWCHTRHTVWWSAHMRKTNPSFKGLMSWATSVVSVWLEHDLWSGRSVNVLKVVAPFIGFVFLGYNKCHRMKACFWVQDDDDDNILEKRMWVDAIPHPVIFYDVISQISRWYLVSFITLTAFSTNRLDVVCLDLATGLWHVISCP